VTHDELRDELGALGREAAWPPTPDLAAAVAGRLEPRPRRASWRPLRPAVVLPVLLALVLAAVALVPPARTAVLDVLGLAAHERIVPVERPPQAPRRAPALGRRVSLAQARAAVGFPVRVPAALGAPPEVRLSRGVPGGAVTLVYGSRFALTEFRGGATPYAQKSVGPRTRIVATEVAGRRAIFLTGAPRRWVALDRDGRPVEATARLVDANVLLLDAGGVGFRLETRAGLARARAVLRSLGI
jgi:hypothetical protein